MPKTLIGVPNTLSGVSTPPSPTLYMTQARHFKLMVLTFSLSAVCSKLLLVRPTLLLVSPTLLWMYPPPLPNTLADSDEAIQAVGLA